MATTREEIAQWFDEADPGSTHMLIVCDEYDHEDYPVYVGPDRNVLDVEREYDSKEMSHVMEVYNLSMDKETQLRQRRAHNY